MPQKALIIELSLSVTEVTPTTVSGHGNTVKSAFLFTAPSGWTADVVDTPYDYGIKVYEYLEANAANYSIAICSYTTDIYYARNFEKIARLLGIPFFQPMPNNQSVETAYYQKSNITYTGGGTTVNIQGRGQRVDTFDVASNITGQTTTTSWVNGAVAGKAAHLVDAGLTAPQVYKAIRQSCAQYPAWDQIDGFGKAPETFTVPASYDVQPPLGVEYFITSGNNIRFWFAKITGDTVDAIRLYKNGVFYAEATSFTPSSASNQINSYEQFYADFLIVSAGGSQTFNASIVSGGVESRLDDYNERTISGFTANEYLINTAPEQKRIYAKKNKAISIPIYFENVNAQAYASVRWRVLDSQQTAIINIAPVAVNATTVFINANATTMNVNTGYYGMAFEGFTGVAGWQPFGIGSTRIDKST